jgi:5-methylcytosine-specific restriction enzyme subunit McrC
MMPKWKITTNDYANEALSDLLGSDVVVNDLEKDLRFIADRNLKDLADNEHLLVFPQSFRKAESLNEDGASHVFELEAKGNALILHANKIMGFIGRNGTQITIRSRFAKGGSEDYFLTYMLQKVMSLNVFDMEHTTSHEDVFDLLMLIFPSMLKKAMSQGLFREYQRRKYNDANVRGPIDVGRHIRLNIPFGAKVAYSTREFAGDNHITQLVRHTIEYIKTRCNGDALLNNDEDTKTAVMQIALATPTYERNQREQIIGANLRPIYHPYYTEYTNLQRLCLQILRHETLKYGSEKDQVYGVLFDGAWLWEEYMGKVLEKQFMHYRRGDRKGLKLFKECQPIIPDYLSEDKSVVGDAKYIPLDRQLNYHENSNSGAERAREIYYKTIMYMYRFQSSQGYLFYPIEHDDNKVTVLHILDRYNESNNGILTKLGLGIPVSAGSYTEFCEKISENEQHLVTEDLR